MVVRRGDKQQRLQVEKLTSDFKNIVEMYSASQQQIAAKMKAIILSNASQNDDIYGDQQQQQQNNNDINTQAKLQLIQQNLEFEQSMMLEREKNVRQIEDDVLDVNQIMRELNVLIHQQGENIGKFCFFYNNIKLC